ncbi:hypothetical protein C0J52_25932 [Blattella germanica]|nr:hypothetical protein C0J52_25932 [Blattella germanica]
MFICVSCVSKKKFFGHWNIVLQPFVSCTKLDLLWQPKSPKITIQQPLHSPKVTCWCGVGTFGIVGPFFFENETGVTETVNSARYVTMFFLWGYLKQNVYTRRLRTLQELKEAIIEEVATIDRDLLLKAFASSRNLCRSAWIVMEAILKML